MKKVFTEREPGIQFVDLRAMIGNNLYVVDIDDEKGEIHKAVINKSYYRSNKGVITKKHWINARMNLFYVVAKNKEAAALEFEKMFEQMDKEIEERNKSM